MQRAMIEQLKNKTVIFYGAGEDASGHLATFAKYGIRPVCFADRDSKKWGGQIDGVEILSPEKAKETYPDFMLFISVGYGMRQIILRELLDRGYVREEQLINYKVTCPLLRNSLVILSREFFFCCNNRINFSHNKGLLPKLTQFDDYDKLAEQILSTRATLLEEIKHKGGRGGSICQGCEGIQKAMVDLESKFSVLHCSENDYCNCACVYCTELARNHMPSGEELGPYIDYRKLIAALKKRDMIDENLVCLVGGGEITVHPPREQLLEAIYEYKGEVLSNCLIYNEQVHRYIQQPGRYLNVSIDAGTPETYAKVKGRNTFSHLQKNLLKYSEGGGHIKTKYIMLPGINDNSDDVDGFIELVAQIGACNVHVSGDYRDLGIVWEDHTVEAFARLVSGVLERGIKLLIMTQFFSEGTLEKIRALPAVALETPVPPKQSPQRS